MKISVYSFALGVFAMLTVIKISDYQQAKKDDNDFAKKVKIVVTNDSINNKVDTFILMPIDISKQFHQRAIKIIYTDKMKTTKSVCPKF